MSNDKVVPYEVYEILARTGKALANPVRLRLLDNLEQAESTVESLAELAEVSLKNTSAQLQQLRAAGLVSTRRAGTKIYYRIASPRVSRFLSQMQEFAASMSAELRAEIDRYFAEVGTVEQVDVLTLRTRAEASEVLIVDTREQDEFELGHLPGAISLPSAEITERIDELVAALDRQAAERNRLGLQPARDGIEIVAYCQGPYCLTSPRAVAQLAEFGVPAVMVTGGITEWIRQGNAVEV